MRYLIFINWPLHFHSSAPTQTLHLNYPDSVFIVMRCCQCTYKIMTSTAYDSWLSNAAEIVTGKYISVTKVSILSSSDVYLTGFEKMCAGKKVCSRVVFFYLLAFASFTQPSTEDGRVDYLQLEHRLCQRSR